jgi:hypothetical protein
MDVARIEIERDEIGWVLRVSNPGMRPQEYRCSSKEQAQALGDVLRGAKGQAKPQALEAAAAPSAAALPPRKR